MTLRVACVFCHPEPGPEASSGSIDFGISVLVLALKEYLPDRIEPNDY